MPNKKIVFFSTMSGFPWGGSEFLWYKTALFALEQGYNVMVSVIKWQDEVKQIKILKEKGAIIHYRPHAISYTVKDKLMVKTRLLQYEKLRQKKLQQIYQIIWDFNPDIICVSQGGTYDIASPDISWFLEKINKPYYLICQYNDEHKILRIDTIQVIKRLFSKAKGIFFVSQRNKLKAEHQLAYNIKNAILIQNPFNISQIGLVSFPISNEKWSFANVARLDCTYKGQDVLIKVLSHDRWKERNWQLNIYGKGPDKDYLKELIHFYGLENKIFLQGYAENIREIWAKNHLQVLPSFGEGTPLSLLEAVLCGRTAIVTDVGGNSDFINQENGFLIDSPTERCIQEGLENAWQKRNEWELLGKKAFEYAIKKIDMNPEIKLFNTIINS